VKVGCTSNTQDESEAGKTMSTPLQEETKPPHTQSRVAVVAPGEVPPPPESYPFWPMLREMAYELVEYRDLLFQLTLRDIRLRYKQAVIGFGWAIFMPMLIVGAGFLVKFAMARMAGTELQPGSFAGMAVKALPWAFFVGAIGFATNSLTGNMSLLSKIYFPREVFPLSAVLAQSFDTIIGGGALAVILLFLGIGFSPQTLWVIPLLGMLFFFTTAMALFLSCANLFFRDVKYVVQVVLTFGIFFTPVFYEPADFGPQGSQLMMLNPLAPLLEGCRLAVVEHWNLSHSLTVMTAGSQILVWHPGYLLYTTAWALLGCVGAWIMFHRLEFLYAEYI
jgi:lipopolysaccharide transport system permease protein